MNSHYTRRNFLVTATAGVTLAALTQNLFPLSFTW